MRSTNYIDFSVRQNKTIERSLIFDGLRRVSQILRRNDLVYVGFGSVWFVDFDVAHREMGIETMISIESEPVTFKRAQFNKPYRTVEVLEGMSHDVIPQMLSERRDLRERPWVVWLDYDDILDETKLDELGDLVETLPTDSSLLTTFSASGGRYGHRVELLERFTELLGDAFPSELFNKARAFRDERKLMRALSSAVVAFLQSKYVQIARPGRFIPAFELQYQDGTPMATAGGVLASPQICDALDMAVSREDWLATSTVPIVTPPLTQREVAALRSLLPTSDGLSRAEVRALGFDLLEEQIASFVEHYLRYPSFVQTAR